MRREKLGESKRGKKAEDGEDGGNTKDHRGDRMVIHVVGDPQSPGQVCTPDLENTRTDLQF